jgi:flagellar hook-length control protein FliK
MINPMLLNLVSSLLNGGESGSADSVTSGNGDRNFLFDMQNALHASSKKSSHVAHEPMKTDTVSNEKGYKYYLESFKKELLAQGKPLNEIFLKESDIPLVKKFLLQCGFLNEKIDGFLKDLKANSPGGQINLSHFFQMASELKSPEEKAYQDKIIASSAIPYIESILRDFQFTPKDMDNVFRAAKVEGGGLDLKKFVTKLKEINTQNPVADKKVNDQNLNQQIIAKMETIGIHLQNKEKIEQISLKDFAASLEQTAKSSNKNDKQSFEIKRTLDGLLKSVTPSDQNVSYTSSIKISQKYNFTNSLIEEKTDKNSNHLFDKKKISSSEKNKADGNEAISSFLKGKNDKVAHRGQLDVNTLNLKERSNIFSELNKKMGSMSPAERDNYRVQTETGQITAPRNTASFNLADAVGTVEYQDNGSRGYLQASLMDQVGKQISKSILRGDRIVRLQLKPPELGTVKIKMDIKDHTLKLGLITEHHSVKELLLNNIHQLKEALLHQGVKLEKVDVQIDYNFSQTMNGSKEGTNSGPGLRRDLNEKQFNSNMLVEGTSAAPMNMISKNNLLDLVA